MALSATHTETLSALDTRIDNTDATVVGLRAELSTERKRVDELKDLLERSNGRVEELEKKMDTDKGVMDGVIDSHKARISGLEDVVRAIKEQIARLEASESANSSKAFR